MTYYDNLIDVIEDDPFVTWAKLSDRFSGRTRETLRGTLIRKHRNDLVTKVDRNSGFEKRTPYSATLVRVIEDNEGLTWPQLSAMFGNRDENSLRAALHYAGRPELVRRVGR